MAASSSATADAAATGESALEASAERSALPSRPRRWLLNAVALFLIYGNAIGVLQAPTLRALRIDRIAPHWVRDAFLLHGMFTSYSKHNADFFIAGLRTQEGTVGDRGSWVPIRLREHFAGRHGVVFTQLFATHHWDIHGKAAQRNAWRALAARIRARHNRLHPDRPLAVVRFGSEEWPQSPLGYRARKFEAIARIWFEESPP